MRRGELRKLNSGEFKGTLLRVSWVSEVQGYVGLQKQDDERCWYDYLTLTREVAETSTVPVLHCPVDFEHHLGNCCLTCGNDEREAGRHLPKNPDLTAEDRARIAHRDTIFRANWTDFYR